MINQSFWYNETVIRDKRQTFTGTKSAVMRQVNFYSNKTKQKDFMTWIDLESLYYVSSFSIVVNQ